MIALALGAFDGDPAAGRVEMRGDALSGKAAFVEGAQTATHFLIFTDDRRRCGGRQRRSGIDRCRSRPASPCRRSASSASRTRRPCGWTIPREALADIALVARLGCAGRALGAARARVRARRGSRQDPKAVRPAHRPVPGGPAQARQWPDQPGRRAAHARSGGRGARQRQPGLARVRRIGAGVRRSGACARFRSRRTGRSAPSAMPRSTRRRGISAACMPISPASAARRAPAPSLPISCSGRSRHDRPSRSRHGPRRQRLPQGGARLAREALDAGEARGASAQALQGPRLGHGVLQADGPRRLDRRRLAEGVRRPGPQRHRTDRLHHRDGELRRARPRPQHQRVDRRAGAVSARHQGAAGRMAARRSAAASASSRSATASRRPAPTSPRCAPAPSATATTGSSTARSCGRPAATRRTTCGSRCAPIRRRRSTPASAC